MLRVVPPGERVPWLAVLREWTEWMRARGLAPTTIRLYQSGLVWMAIDTFTDPLDVTPAGFAKYLNELDPKGSKRDNAVKAARSFYGLALKRGYITADPAVDFPPIKHHQGDAPTLSDDELRRIFRAAFRKDPRRGWTLMLMYATGARAGSMVPVRPEDIDLERNLIRFTTAKWDKPYTVPLGRRGRIAARQLLALMTPKPEPMRGKRACTTCHLRPILAKGECRRCYRYRQDFLRRRPSRLDQHVGETVLGLKTKTVLWYWVSEAGEAAGLKCSPHLLRHAFATKLGEDPTVDPRTWMELMNHSDLGQFRRYTAARQEHLKSAVERL